MQGPPKFETRLQCLGFRVQVQGLGISVAGCQSGLKKWKGTWKAVWGFLKLRVPLQVDIGVLQDIRLCIYIYLYIYMYMCIYIYVVFRVSQNEGTCLEVPILRIV